MPEYLAPGVYIKEVPSANKAIQAASTSTAGMVGQTERGPVGIPTFISSAAQFKRIFGGLLDHTVYTGGKDALPHAVNGFFSNGGSRVYVVRVLDKAALPASKILQGGGVDTLKVFAQSKGAWGNALRLTITDAARVKTKLTADALADATSVTLVSTFGLNNGDKITIGGKDHVVALVKANNVINITPKLAAKADKDTVLETVEFDMLIERVSAGVAVETELFTGLSLNPTLPNYAPRLLGSCDTSGGTVSETGDSQMVRLFQITDARPTAGVYTLAGGADGAVTDATYIGDKSENPSERTGLQALANEPGISLVAIPGNTSVSVQNAILDHCDEQVYRFAVLDMPLGATMGEARTHRGNFDSTRGAIYHPWLSIADPFGPKGTVHNIPPSGHMLGVYARTDNTRGVWKTPANEVINSIIGFESAVNKAEQDILNPINVNCMRDFRSQQRGLRVWGGRTLSSDPEWKYIAVRRTFLFVEQSLDSGLQYAVFEPNGKALWDTVRQSISGFLDSVWRQGGLAGATRDEAFYVNVGYNLTMQQADLDNGLLIVEVGIAPLFPAEFVVIRISQKTLEALK